MTVSVHVRQTGGVAFLLVVVLALVGARLALYAVSAEAPVAEGTWRVAQDCGRVLCIANPDTGRYVALVDYFVSTGRVLDNPLSALSAGVNYEGSFLGASKNGVAYSYVAAGAAQWLGISAILAASLVSLVASVLLAFTMRGFFIQRGFSRGWLVAATVSPIVTYYGNQAMKETFDAWLLLVLVRLVDRRLSGHGRSWTKDLVVGSVVAFLLYFDREYYLFLALAIWALLWMSDRQRKKGEIVLGGLGAIFVLLMAIERSQYTFAPLSGYYDQYATGSGFGSLHDLVIGTPQTLLAPIGGLNDPRQAILLVLSLPLFAAYIALVGCAVRGEVGEPGYRTGWLDPYLLAFITMVVLWTITYGGGFERGRAAVAPLLFVAAARWEHALRVEPHRRFSGPSPRPSHDHDRPQRERVRDR